MKLTLHQSGMKQLLDCELKYYLEEVTRDISEKKYLPMYWLVGTAVHRTIQLLHFDVSLFKDPVDVLPILIDKFIDEELSFESSQGNEYVWDRGEKRDRQSIIEDFAPAIANYCKAPWNDPDTYNLLVNETSFRLTKGNAVFQGTIDQVREYKDNAHDERLRKLLVEIDLKTGKETPNSVFLSNDIQHSMYSLACLFAEEMWEEDRYNTGDGWVTKTRAVKPIKRKPDENWWYHIRNHIPYKRNSTKQGVRFSKGDERGDPRFVTSRSEKELSYWFDYFCKLHFRIRSGNVSSFLPRPSQRDCTMCKVASMCSAVIRGDTEGKEKINNLLKEAGIMEAVNG